MSKLRFIEIIECLDLLMSLKTEHIPATLNERGLLRVYIAQSFGLLKKSEG